MALKFNLKSFEELDTPNLLINVWSYSENLNKINPDCNKCKTYRKYCLQILRRRWNWKWGFFNEVISNIKSNNENFIDLSRYSSANRFQIITDLKKIQKENSEKYGFCIY